MTMLKDTTVTTRKPHPCAWCDEPVPAGETVRYRAYIWDGGITSEWWHPECWDAMLRVPSDELEEGFLAGDYLRGGTEYQN